MSKGILNCLKKRDLLHDDKVPAEAYKRLGWEYLQDDRPLDALDFFEKAGDQEGLSHLRRIGLEQGDIFLLQQSSKLLKVPVSEAEWRQAGEKALAEGRYQQAVTAFQAAGDETRAQEAQGLLDRLQL